MPSNKLHQAKVLLHRPAGRGYYRLVLLAPVLAAAAAPGHFVMLRVSSNLDPLLARPFGISSVISKRSIELYYRVAGRGTTLLTTVEKGQLLSVIGPLGNGFPAPDKAVTPLLVAGGSGFPPLLYFADWYGKQARLFVGSRDKDCLPPAAVMKDLHSRTKSIHYATEDGSRGVCGFVTDSLAGYVARPTRGEAPVIYACGPHAMLESVSRLAAEHSIPCYVSMEERMACGLGVCMGCSVSMKAGGYKRVCKEGPVFDSREIDWNEHMTLKMKVGR